MWDRWLLVATAGVAIYALALVVAGGFVGDQVFDRLGFGPADGDIADGNPRDYVIFVYGVLGAVIIGWTASLVAIVRGPLRRREAWAWWALAGAVGVWFLVDTTLSPVLGYVGHALFNIGFVVILGIPMLAIGSELE
jgi:hypothetical protein